MKRKLLSAICVVIFAIAMVAMTACTPLTHTVTFVNYDGSTLYSVVVDHNGIPSYEGETPVRAEDDEFIYEFNGWLDAEGNLCEKFPVTGADVTYTASYAKTAKYVIVFMNGTEAIEQLVLVEGSAVAYGGSTPAKAADEQYTYTFAGWSLSEGGEIVEIAPVATESVTYYAVYTTTNNYRINFVNGSETLQSSLLVEGSAVAYDGATPVKAETEAYRYNFLGWSLSEGGELVEIASAATESVTYYAVFEEIAKLFTVTFVGANGETLASSDMLVGQVPAYEGATPVKAADVYYTYTFIGWDKELAPVTAPATYVAQFSSTLRTYNVTWNVEGVEAIATFNAGEQITYDGATPVKADDENHRYTFAGWSLTAGGEATDLGLALANATYYAVFTSQNLYTVTFTDETGKVLESHKVLEGECATFAGQIPVKESTAQYAYEYLGWIVDGVTYSFEDILPEVYENATYALELKATLKEYEIVWVVEGVSTAKDVAYGEVPSYGADPSKEGNAEYSYTFAGWSLTAGGAVVEVSAVTGAVTYYAVFTETVNKYTVKFFNIQGIQLLEEHLVAYGEVPVFEGTLPTWDANEAMTFHPAWVDGETVYDLRYDTLPAVTGDVTYVFRNIAEVNKYTVTINYVVNSGAVSAPASKLLTLDYGTIYGEEDTTSPAISGFAPDRYWFAGYLTSNVTYTVTYNAVNTWDGSTATSFESGSGTEKDPYIIKTGAQLAYLSKLGADNTSAKNSTYGDGLYYKLGASIDLSNYQWTPICARDSMTSYNWTYFNGSFDGAGYTIIMNISNTGFGYGLFQTIGDKAVVKNLTIAGQVSVKHRAGSIAYMANAGAVVDNVHNYANVLTTVTSGDYWVGGLFGSVGAATISNSSNYGKVTGANLTGGLIGQANGTIFTNCANYGDVVAGASAQRVGGIAGYLYGSGKATNCVNFGTITGGKATIYKSDKTTVDYYCAAVGGINGYAGASTTSNCVNYGEIIQTQEARYVGGINGISSGAIVTDCVNYGTINSVGSYNGGIVGTTQSSSKTLNSVNHGKVITSGVNTGGVTGYLGAGSYVDGCSNWATITSTAEDLGGVIGENQSNPGINAANVNYGDVSGTVRVGGIVGRQVKNSINNSENYGDVTGTGARVGGIFGDGYGASIINNCVNSGTITGVTQYFGGIGGQAANKMVLTNCVNYGDVVASVSSANNFAGIVGFVTDGSFLVLCVNYGDVSGGSTMGGIAGYLGGSAAIETASRVEGCVNYGTINGTGTAGGIVGLNNGYVTKHVAEDGTETMTINVADVTSSGAFVGGICGNTSKSDNCVASLTEYAINYGTITAGKNSDSVSSVGGINGQLTNKGTIQYCENYGAVTGSGNQVGGITGYNNGTVSNCYNEGDIYGGGNYTGGIVGENKYVVTDVENKGNIKAYTSYIGGCVGRNDGGSVSNATNHGSVTAERAASKAGTGIGGVIGSNQNSADAANLANYGDVLGYTQVGGISGYQGAGSSIDGAVNEGNVTGYGTVGQIVGTNNSADLTTNVSGTGTVTDHNP